MNEINCVVGYKVVGSDARLEVIDLFEEIWNCSGRQIVTKALYTDNLKTDRNTFTNVWKKYHSKANPNDFYVLQDIFHAQNRVLKVMKKSHANFYNASKELKSILYQVTSQKKENIYQNEQEIEAKLRNWCDKWSSKHMNNTFTVKESLVLIGNSYRWVTVIF